MKLGGRLDSVGSRCNSFFFHGETCKVSVLPQCAFHETESLAIWHYEDLEVLLTKFEVDLLNPLEGVLTCSIPVKSLKLHFVTLSMTSSFIILMMMQKLS